MPAHDPQRNSIAVVDSSMCVISERRQALYANVRGCLAARSGYQRAKCLANGFSR